MAEPERGPGAQVAPEEVEALAAEAAAEEARARVLSLRAEAAAAAAAESGTEVDDDAVETGTRRRTSVTVLAYMSAVLAVIGIAVLASTSAWIIVKHRQAEHQRDLSADFSAAARQGVVSLMSLNFSSAEQDVQRILDNSTGDFRKDFQQQSGDFTKVAESSKVVTEATVTATAVKSMTDDTADVLVSAFSTVSNQQGGKEDPRTWRLIVSMARDGGQIKMAKVEFAP